ncbi:MAG: SusF/SusE family outer membrane protein [Bacteroidota bacterium]|nr:SusF/SusE family outer membrane protein [Bacteroidota bacterium]
MKHILNLFSAILVMALAFTSCQKVAPLKVYGPGQSPVLSSSVTSTTPTPADSLKNVISFSWTNPKYANDSATTKYVLEFDSSGRNFSREQTITLNGSLSDTLTGKSLNNILLALGFAYNTTYNVDVRLTASYANNNEQLTSNVLTLQMTPYVVPPKVAPPASNTLFLVGSATAGGWGNPVPVPAQQFTRLDSVTYQGTFYLNGGQQYLLLPVNGDWTHKYSVQDNTIAGLSAGGDFGADLPSNFPGPATTGMYQITVDFQHGKFSVTSVSQYGLLYVPGDYQGWSPSTAPALGSPKNDGNYEGYVNITTTGGFKFTSEADWNGTNYGDTAANGQSGILSTSGNNLNVPAAGYYLINANTTANTWSATPITSWSMIGSFAASGWSNDVDMTYNSGSNTWTGTITTAAGDQFKFRANHSWNINLGESGQTGSLVYNGDNIGDPTKNFSVPAGTHNVTLFLNNAGYYTFMIQ